MSSEFLDGVSLREMTVADYPAVRSSWEAEPGINLSSVDTLASVGRLLSHSPGISLVAEKDKRIIGSLLGSQDTRRGYVHHLVVDPAFRGFGLGRLLMEKVLSCFVAAGIPKVHLFVMRSNPEVLEFYRHLGWKERTDLIMFSRDIPAAAVNIHE